MQEAKAKSQEDADADGGPAERRLFIEDGADGCWVTFTADAAGNCMPIGRGAFSMVWHAIDTPSCCLQLSVPKLVVFDGRRSWSNSQLLPC